MKLANHILLFRGITLLLSTMQFLVDSIFTIPYLMAITLLYIFASKFCIDDSDDKKMLLFNQYILFAVQIVAFVFTLTGYPFVAKAIFLVIAILVIFALSGFCLACKIYLPAKKIFKKIGVNL